MGFALSDMQLTSSAFENHGAIPAKYTGEAEDVSLVHSTSEGLSLIAEGYPWRKGDQVLVGEEEFAANVAPWLNLARRGVEVLRAPQPGGRVGVLVPFDR